MRPLSMDRMGMTVGGSMNPLSPLGSGHSSHGQMILSAEAVEAMTADAAAAARAELEQREREWARERELERAERLAEQERERKQRDLEGAEMKQQITALGRELLRIRQQTPQTDSRVLDEIARLKSELAAAKYVMPRAFAYHYMVLCHMMYV